MSWYLLISYPAQKELRSSLKWVTASLCRRILKMHGPILPPSSCGTDYYYPANYYYDFRNFLKAIMMKPSKVLK
ncbi:MAG: hypothetical protein R2879_03915 [Saprospiraceae bacterium]